MPPAKTVPASVKKALRDELRNPDLGELSAWFFKTAGGTKAVAVLLYEEFAAAKAGSLMRQRILEMILRSAKFADDRRGPKDELGLLTEEDLERQILALVGRSGGEEVPSIVAEGPGPART